VYLPPVFVSLEDVGELGKTPLSWQILPVL
jgi:hypothetical protein